MVADRSDFHFGIGADIQICNSIPLFDTDYYAHYVSYHAFIISLILYSIVIWKGSLDNLNSGFLNKYEKNLKIEKIYRYILLDID
jgi:hypothetical protein